MWMLLKQNEKLQAGDEVTYPDLDNMHLSEYTIEEGSSVVGVRVSDLAGNPDVFRLLEVK